MLVELRPVASSAAGTSSWNVTLTTPSPTVKLGYRPRDSRAVSASPCPIQLETTFRVDMDVGSAGAPDYEYARNDLDMGPVV